MTLALIQTYLAAGLIGLGGLCFAATIAAVLGAGRRDDWGN